MTKTNTAVARAATISGALRQGDLALIGIVASGSGTRALLRTREGRVKSVRPGDRLDGVTVTAIGESSVQVQALGAPAVIEMPGG